MQGGSLESGTREAPTDRRVLIVTDDLVMGGMERQLTLLATALQTTSAVRVFSLGDGVYAPVLREAGVPLDVFARESRFDVKPALPLRRIISEWRPTVVHTFGWMSMAAAIVPCRLSGIPLVDGSIRDGAVPTRRGRLMQAMIARADVVIANSQAGLDAFGVDPGKGRVVYNGFDPERWPLCRPGSAPDRPTTVIMTARMHCHKDYRGLLDAARILDAEAPGAWRFLAVGSGEDREALMAEYCDLIEGGVAEFPQAGTEVLSLVSASHIGVLLTDPRHHAEGLSNSIMEYMACGLPVICTHGGGNSEVVVEGETGLFVAPGDTQAVVDALRALRDDPATAAHMGAAGRERIRTVFTVDALVDGTVAAYDLAVERRRARGRTPR